MPDAHWENLKQIFHAASALPLNERDAYVDKACKGDLALRSAVAGLLKSHEETGNFIDSPAFQAAAEMLASRGQLKAGQIAKVLTVSPGTAMRDWTFARGLLNLLWPCYPWDGRLPHLVF